MLALVPYGSFKAAHLPIKQMQNFEALFLPHPDAAERFRAFAPITSPRRALAAADMPDELLQYVYAHTRVASSPRVLHVDAAHFDHDEVLRLADDARIVISTNLGHEGKHPASRLRLRIWLDQEVNFSLPVPRSDNDEPGFVSVTGPSSAHDARHMIVECAITLGSICGLGSSPPVRLPTLRTLFSQRLRMAKAQRSRRGRTWKARRCA